MKKLRLLASFLVVMSAFVYAMDDGQSDSQEFYIFAPLLQQNISRRIAAIQTGMQQKETTNVKTHRKLSDIQGVAKQITPPTYVPYHGLYLVIHDKLIELEKEVLNEEGKGIEVKPTMKMKERYVRNKIATAKFPPSWQGSQHQSSNIKTPPSNTSSKDVDNNNSNKANLPNQEDEEDEAQNEEEDAEAEDEAKLLARQMNAPKNNPQKTKPLQKASGKKSSVSPCLIMRFLGGGAAAVGITAAILYYFLVYKKRAQEQSDSSTADTNNNVEQSNQITNDANTQAAIAQAVVTQ